MAPLRDEPSGFPMAVLVEGGLVLAAALLAWILGVPLRQQFPSASQPLGMAIIRGVLATLPMLALFWTMVRSRRSELRQLRKQVEWLVREMFPSGDVAQFAFVALLAGVGEELLFRGVLQTKLGEWTTPAAGLVFASLLFGAAHALSKVYFVLATVIGLYLGWFAQYFGEIVTPIVAHALYDFLALVYLSRAGRSRIFQTPPEGGDDNDRHDPHDSIEH